MRKQLLLVLSLVLITSVSPEAQILFQEDFNYPAGDTIGAHGWTGFSSFVNPLSIATSGLIYSGYVQSGIGNSLRVRNNGQDAYKDFAPDSTGNIYISFMVRIDSVKPGGDYFFAFLPPNNTSFYTARFYAKDSSGNVSFGVSKSTNPIVYSGPNYTLGTTYLIVIKYTFLAGGPQDDEVRLFIFSGAIPSTEPAPLIGPVTQAINDNVLGRVAIRQGSATTAPTLNIDGMRVFKSWGWLVGVRPISTIAEQFSLSQNYPNPFNPNTNIRFSIPERGFVSLKVYDMLGKEVSSLVEGNYSIGTYEVNLDGKGLSSGAYIYRMSFTSESGKEYADTKKLMLVK
ncbi:MAG TPA: T9SS type A sorting domain-containing protein [Ignavibacteria bacterium]|jgi:hypothetical protein